MSNADKKTVAPAGKTAENDFPELVESLCSLKNGSTAGMKKRWQEQAGTPAPPHRRSRAPV